MPGNLGDVGTIDDQISFRNAHGHELADALPRNRVEVLPVADATLAINGPVEDFGCVVGFFGKRDQMRQLLLMVLMAIAYVANLPMDAMTAMVVAAISIWLPTLARRRSFRRISRRFTKTSPPATTPGTRPSPSPAGASPTPPKKQRRRPKKRRKQSRRSECSSIIPH